MDSKEYLADKIVEFRKESGYTYEEVGRAIGRSRQTVSCWEKMTRQPTSDDVVKLAAIFGRSISDFYPPEQIDAAEGARDGFVRRMDELSVREWALVKQLRKLSPEALDETEHFVSILASSRRYQGRSDK